MATTTWACGAGLNAHERNSRARAHAQRWVQITGVTTLRVRGAALLPGQARGWTAGTNLDREKKGRDGQVWVHFGPCTFVGWPVVEAGAPPAAVLGVVRGL